MSGFLNDLGLENVEADPNFIAAGPYPAIITKSEVKPKSGEQVGNNWILTYTIQAGKFQGKTQSEFFDLNPQGDKAEIKKSFLKKRVLSLGVPENQISNMDPQFAVGLAGVVTIKHGNGYQNVADFKLNEGAASVPNNVTPLNTQAGMTSPTNLM
jgi:hypothetical protein